MVLWGLGAFVAASTVRSLLLRPKPEASAPAQAKDPAKPRQTVARYPNRVWSVDRTRVWPWHVWPIRVLVAIDRLSRMVAAARPLEWLRRVPVIRGLDHLSQLRDDFSQYYNHWRGHSTIGGALPSVSYRGDRWRRDVSRLHGPLTGTR
jgi:transposase InsO family protein